jgi:hypothetical protein
MKKTKQKKSGKKNESGLPRLNAAPHIDPADVAEFITVAPLPVLLGLHQLLMLCLTLRKLGYDIPAGTARDACESAKRKYVELQKKRSRAAAAKKTA